MADPARSDCVDPEAAAGYAARQLPDAELAAIELHIDGCASCRELISALAKAMWSTGSRPDADAAGSADADPTDPIDPSGPTVPADSADPRGARGAVGGVLPRGTAVGPFEIDQPLDAGGMGLVYIARDARLDRRVALKGVREHRGDADQLLQEARMMARLAHPNVVPIYDVIDAHGQIFLAMELIVGRSVRQWLDGERRGWKPVVAVFLAAGAGLAAAHAAGIVHGDVKPANMLHGDDGRIRITDFGLASGSEPRDDDGATGAVRGTPAYMAPEQRAGTPCDALGDQYAFCASLYEAIYGVVPAATGSAGAATQPASPRAGRPTTPPARTGRVPRAIRRILARGLAADPHARYPSMNHLLRELRATASARRRWAIAGAIAVAAIGVVAYTSGGRRVEARMCEASAPALTSPWDASARFALRSSFARTKLSYAPQILSRVEANLDHWTAAFEAARRDACEPGWFGGGPALDRFSAELGCLEDHAQRARAVVSVFRDTPDATTVLNAIGATEQLGAPSACDRPPVAHAAAISPARQQLSAQLARAFALMAAGKFQDALPVNRALVQAADATGDPLARAAAMGSLAKNQVSLSQHADATKNLLEAIRLAELAQDDRLRVQAWVNLLTNEYQLGHYERALELSGPALGAAERVGDVYLRTEILIVTGSALNQLGRSREAQPQFEQAVQLRRVLYGEHNRNVGDALTALGNAYAMQGQLDAGITAHRQAVEIAEAVLGPTHPNVAVAHGNLGDDYLYGLQIAPAVAEFDKAAAIFEAAYGAKHRSVASTLTDLGLALVEAKQYERAVTTLDRANSLWNAVNPKHPSRGEALLGRYLALESLGRPAEVADLETALVLGQQLPPFERARIQLALGRATTDERSTALIKSAIAGLASSTLPLIQRDLTIARDWQRDHSPPPPPAPPNDKLDTHVR